MSAPKIGHFFKSESKKLSVVVKSMDLVDITVCKIGADRKEKGKPFSLTVKEWEKYGFEDLDDSPKEEPKDTFTSANPHRDEYKFTYDPDTKKITVWKNGAFHSEMNAFSYDGKDAYQLWADKQPAGKDTSYQAYMKEFRGESGKDGSDGRDLYDIWKEEQGGDNPSKTDFFNYFKGEKGRDGIDGKDLYEIWKSKQKPEDQNLTAFFKAFRGQDGRNGDDGKSAYDFWKEKQERGKDSEVDFLSFLEGKPGADGESAFQLWQRLYPDEPNKTEEGFLRWIAKQVETQKGDPGDTYIPFVKDGHLFFRKNGGEGPMPFDPLNIIGEVGDTYEPHVDENGNIWFTSKKGNKPTTPVNIKGEQGKSAYDLWREEPGNANKSYDEFKESLRGADGVNVKAKYDFKDLEDYVCPVQKIPTHLLLGTDGLEDGKSAEGILDDRADEIRQMRNDGEALSKEPWYYLKHLFKEVTWWCAGADRALLRMCPADHSKYAGIGTVILFTALMATFSSFIAMQFVLGVGSEGLLNWSQMKVTPGPYIIAGVFAIFWGMMIFFLDRFITNTMYSDGKVTISWLEFRSALPRIVISILLGIVISAPLELKIFDGEIQKYLDDSALFKAKRQLFGTDEYIIRHNNYDAEEKKVEGLLNTYTKIASNPNDSAYRVIDKNQIASETDKTKTYTPTKDQYGNRTTATSIGGGSRTFGTTIDTTKYKAALEAADLRYKKAKKELSDLESKMLNEDSIQTQKLLVSIKEKGFGLFDNLMALHAVAMKEEIPINNGASINKNAPNPDGYHPLDWGWGHQLLTGVVLFFLLMSFTFKSYFGVFGDDEEEMAGKTRKWNFITNVPICLVVAIICALCYESFHWLFYYLTTAVGLIMLLFIIIDVSPVFYKMMLADGVYDKKLHEDKKIVEDKIRYNLAKTLYKMDRSELKNIAPFVFSHTYQKMTKKESKSKFFTGPVGNNETVCKRDEALFKRVLEQKELIIKAAYDAWFRNMRDAIIGGSQPPGSGNDRTQGEKFRPEDNFTQGPGSSFGNDNAKSESENPDNTNDGDFEETSSHSSENVDNSTSEKESSYSNDENSQYESVVDDDDLNESETPKD